jgi:hypothetical protein
MRRPAHFFYLLSKIEASKEQSSWKSVSFATTIKNASD